MTGLAELWVCTVRYGIIKVGKTTLKYRRSFKALQSAILPEGFAQPVDVTIQDKPNFEQINLINQLDEEDRTVVFKIIDTMLTKKKFKDFYQQNAAAL